MQLAGAAQVLAFLYLPGRREGLFPLNGQGERKRSSHLELKVRERGTCTWAGVRTPSGWRRSYVPLPVGGTKHQ